MLSEKQTDQTKKTESYGKIKDFEYERFMSMKLSLLHYLNAQMLIQAKQFETCAEIFDKLEDHNEAFDLVKTFYNNADWARDFMVANGKMNVAQPVPALPAAPVNPPAAP